MNVHEAMAEIESGKFRPVYLVWGEEAFLREEFVRALKQAAVPPETADFNYHVLEPGPDQLEQALILCQTQPFFARQRLVVVKDYPGLLPPRRKAAGGEEEDGAGEKPAAGRADEALLEYLKAPVRSSILLFLAESVDSRRKLAKAILAAGGGVECRVLKAEDATMWAQRRAQAKGKRLTSQAALLLVERVGPDLRLLDGEIEKLCLYVGEAREIGPRDVEALVPDMVETEIYRLTEAVMLKQRKRALELLERCLRQVDHPLQLLVALTNKFRQVLQVKALVERRLPRNEGASLLHMRPYAYQKMTEHVAAIRREEVLRALERLLEADLAIKSGADPRLILESVVVSLL